MLFFIYILTLISIGINIVPMKVQIPNLMPLVKVAFFLIGLCLSCKKNISTESTRFKQIGTNIIQDNEEGFFLDDWIPKSFLKPQYIEGNKIMDNSSVQIYVESDNPTNKVSRYIYGNNVNPYMTQIITEPILMDQITKLSPNVIRFPGGGIADLFFWNAEKNHVPNDVPEKLFNLLQSSTAIKTGFWYGRNQESWTLSLDNYYKMLSQTSSKGIITVNYGYARYGTGTNPVTNAAHYAAEWVRYDNGRTKFWEIGNESFGEWMQSYKIDVLKNKDGQSELISGELYGRHFTIFADSMRKAAAEVGSRIKIGLQLIEHDASSTNNAVYKHWNNGVLSKVKDGADFFIVHNYYTPYKENSTISTILNSGTISSEEVMNYLKLVTKTNDVKMKPVALTEWNIFAEGSKQQVSQIAGLHAVIVLGELMKNRYGLANRWNFANNYDNGNDHGMFSQGDEAEGVERWTPRPSFYYMYYFQKCFGDRIVPSKLVGSSEILCYSSKFSSGEAGIILLNKGLKNTVCEITVHGFNPETRYYYYILSGEQTNNGYSKKLYINNIGPNGPSGGPKGYDKVKAFSLTGQETLKIAVPPLSAVFLITEVKL